MAGGPGTNAHPALRAVEAVEAALDELAAANLWSLSDREVLVLRERLEGTRARLESRVLASTRELDARGAALATGAASTAGWLRGRLRLHPGAAKAEVILAEELDAELAATGARLAAGEISRDQAAAVARAVGALPRGLAPPDRAAGEAFLLGQAGTFDPAALHRLGRHLALTLDPERGGALERAEAQMADRQEFTLVHGLDGGGIPRGFFAPEGRALLQAALDAVSAPRPAADGTPDPRPAAQRRAEGLLELIRLALTAPDMPEHGGEPVTLLVTVPSAALHRHPHRHPDPGAGDAAPDAAGAHAALPDGTPLSPESVRRLGCDAWLIAAIIESGPEVLDIGRMSRTVPRGIRRALITRDQGCAFPGCGRPPRWCHAHHIWHWEDGGPTALTNLVLLCGHHHRVIHHDGWTVRIGDNGRPVFRPPRWIDPDQHPRPAWRPPTLDGHLPLRT